MKMFRVLLLATAILVLLINTNSQRVNAQMAVQDPVVAAELIETNVLAMEANATQAEIAATQSTMSSTVIALKEQQTLIEDLQKATGFVQDAQSIIQLGQLISQLVCVYENLNLMLKRNGMLAFCHIQAHYQFAFINIRMAMDILNMVIQGGLRMDQGLRVVNVKNSLDLFQKGHDKLLKLTRTMQTIGYRAQNQQKYQSNFSASASIYRY